VASIEFEALLTEYRALLKKYTALLMEYRTLLMKCSLICGVNRIRGSFDGIKGSFEVANQPSQQAEMKESLEFGVLSVEYRALLMKCSLICGVNGI